MEKQETDTQPTRQAIPVMLIAQPMMQDQVTFASMLDTLSKRKLLIVVISAMVTGIGLSIALLTPPVYRSEVTLLPPSLSDISGLGSVNEANRTTPAAVYNKFMETMKSKSLRNAFFLDNGLLSELAPEAKTAVEKRKAFSAFDKTLVVEDRKVTLEGTDPDLTARWLNDFVQNAAQASKDKVIADVNSAIQSEKTSLSIAIEAKRKTAAEGRADQIAQLEEALDIAAELGITDFTLSLTDSLNKGKAGSVSVATATVPLYMHGTKTLKAEINTLKSRTNDDPFIPDRHPLLERLFLLDSVHIDAGKVQPVRIDEAAVSGTYIKPKRKLIVLASLIAGIILGVLGAFMVEAASRKRET